jgi:hypothetical protein
VSIIGIKKLKQLKEMNVIINSNIEIGEFLGFQKTDIGYFDNDESLLGIEDDNTFNADELKFHRNWNWLMVAVHKIETIENGFFCRIVDGNPISIETVYDGVRNFVNAYNKQTDISHAESGRDIRKEVNDNLLEFYHTIGMDQPDNHDDILDFCVDDVVYAADPIDWHSGDVVIAFRRWIESSKS